MRMGRKRGLVGGVHTFDEPCFHMDEWAGSLGYGVGVEDPGGELILLHKRLIPTIYTIFHDVTFQRCQPNRPTSKQVYTNKFLLIIQASFQPQLKFSSRTPDQVDNAQGQLPGCSNPRLS